MPTINLGRKTKTYTLNIKYQQKVYQDVRWKKLRSAKFADSPLCELCLAKGIVHQTEEIHHIKPFSISDSQEQIEALAYDWNNLISLCIECHHKEHQRLKL